MRTHLIVGFVLSFCLVGIQLAHAADLEKFDVTEQTANELIHLDEDNECRARAEYKSLQCHQRYLDCQEEAKSFLGRINCTNRKTSCQLVAKLEALECEHSKNNNQLENLKAEQEEAARFELDDDADAVQQEDLMDLDSPEDHHYEYDPNALYDEYRKQQRQQARWSA